MATLRGQPVDRPAVNFYEVGGFLVNPANPDPFNIYTAPDWQPLLRLAEEHTDLIRMMSPVRARSHDPTGSAASAVWQEFFHEETHEENDCRITHTTVRVAGRTLTQTTKRERDLDTIWTTEHLLKDAEDARAFLQIPDEAFAETVDVQPLLAAEAAVGERGIVMVDTEDPLCAAAALFSLETYTVLALTEQELFHQLLENFARRIQARTEQVSRLFPDHLWRIYGAEYASAPYLPPGLFRDYVVRYTGPMVRAIQAHGGFARILSHGRLRDILDDIAAMQADALDPIEPPPQGDMELREVRERVGRQMVLFGNLEVSDIELLPPEQFAKKVRCALDEGTRGNGRGFVVMPSASPYGRAISTRTLQNYETIVRLAEAW